MIELTFQCGRVFIWSADVWETLRKQYRIVGRIIGGTESCPGLPSILLPEEAALLLSIGAVKVVTIDKVTSKPEDFKKLEEDFLAAQGPIYRESRKRLLDTKIDEIVAGKRRKNSTQTREEIYEEALNQGCHIDLKNMVWPTLLTPLPSAIIEKTETPLEEILENCNSTRVAVFADLWHKGHYITTGHQFGGDFLVYFGDPVAYHAIYIVRCITDTRQGIHPSEIVAIGRLGSSVKKLVLFASFNEDTKEVSYITINWSDADLGFLK